MIRNGIIKKQSLISLMILFIILIFFISLAGSKNAVAFADSDYTPVVTVEQKVAHRGQAFTIDVDLSDNEGLISLYLTLDYDKKVIELIDVTQRDALGTLTFTNTNSQTSQGFNFTPFNLLWDGKKSDSTNGTIATLTFKSYATAPIGTYPITMTYNAINTNKEYDKPIPINIVNGSITLIKGEFEAIYYDWDGSVLYKKEYNSDESPSYEGKAPFRAEDDCYTYKFNDWKPVVSDSLNTLKFVADYTATPKTYQVFYYADGVNESSFDGLVTSADLWQAYEVDYGTFLENEYPQKARYVFSGWHTDAECTKPFLETHMPAKNLSLYGYFVYDIRTTSIPKIQLTSTVEDDDVTVYANMVFNTGFNGLVLNLDYDRTAMEFVGYEQEDAFSALQFDTTNTDHGYDVDEFKFYYEHSENTYETGVFLKMKFKIKKNATPGQYETTFTVERTGATYINGTNGIRYTEIEVIGAQVPVGKIYKWEKSAENDAEITVESDVGLPADTSLKVTLVSERDHQIDREKVEEAAGTNMELKAVYDLKLLRLLDETVSEVTPEGDLSVEIKLTADQQACKDLKLYHIDENGQLIEYEYERFGDVIRFTTDRLDRWAIVGNKPHSGKLSDSAVLLISMPILLAIATFGYTLIILGKYRKKIKKLKKEKIDR